MDSEVRLKQRELQELQESRVLRLNEAIASTQVQLSELSNKYQILREDYSYNLDLLEAKDIEIIRLDESLRVSNEERISLIANIKTLNIKVESLENKEVQHNIKSQQDKANIKVFVKYNFR